MRVGVNVALILVLVLTWAPLTVGQDREEIGGLFLSKAGWERSRYVPTWRLQWKYHRGDDPRWASPVFDDSAWERAGTEFQEHEPPRSNWGGVGWFRLDVVVDSTFPRRSIGMNGVHSGDIRVYWDGLLITDELAYRIPDQIPLGGPGRHVLAVRYELAPGAPSTYGGLAPGFFIEFGEFHASIETVTQQKAEQVFFTAMALAFGVLHLMLFVFSPGARGNLYYALFLFTIGAVIYADIQHAFLASQVWEMHQYLLAHRLLVPLSSIFFLRFLYSIFYTKCPRQFWVFTAVMAAAGMIIVVNRPSHYEYYVVASTLLTLEIVRILVVAIRRHVSGAWIVAGGIFLVVLFSAYDALLDLNVTKPLHGTVNAYYYGLGGLVTAMSAYLARDFARTARQLVAQVQRTKDAEMAHRLVEADNARKTQELEEARQLQLSLLPQCRNDIPGVDVCFHMETATEIGGDYYDYLVREDGSFIVAVGDATGHGMKAGTMVSIVKGLVITHLPQEDFPTFMRKSSDAIKQMRLGNLYMGLTLAEFKDGILRVASAGMPPVCVYRSVSHTVEEIVIKSMPLGGPGGSPYAVREAQLGVGDAVLLLSDGLPELFDPQREMLDYPRVRDLFRKSAGQPATETVALMADGARRWLAGGVQGDDITIVVVKRTV